jgi:RNA polymerase sigma-70 factor (ECF subfamily)
VGEHLSDDADTRFLRIYDRGWRPVLAYALRRVSPEDAADVLVETFTIAWQHLAEVPDDETLVLWLYVTARGVLANLGRRAQARSRLVERIAAEIDRGVVGSACPGEPSHEDALVATDVLATLSLDDREVLMLAAWEGLSTVQLASVLNCSTSAARVRLHRARARLQASLAERGLSEGSREGSTKRSAVREVDDRGRNAATTQH